jgi:hypothetical protein
MAAVLDAVRANGVQLSGEEAECVGARQVMVEEVCAAIKHSKPGKSPGLDGLPVEVYRVCMQSWAPLLAKVFTAMSTLQQLPAGLLDGVIVAIFKKGQRTNPADYRPITLLNTDYRILAKILAFRLKSVQGKLIGREQTAFLPGRHIGENVMVLQLLPHALAPSSEAAVVFVDFAKAYDTVARPFLYALLEAAGLGGGFLDWVKLLLTDTYACACVNGFVSHKVAFLAGVRQGCPMAPQLYLFVGQALLLFLKAKGFGVQVNGRCITACQFADDTEVFLERVAQVSEFLQVMTVFKAASGQGLNASKTELMMIGKEARRQIWTAWYSQQLQQQQQQQQQQHPAPPAHIIQHRREPRVELCRPGHRVPIRSALAVHQRLHQQTAVLMSAWQQEHRQQALSQARQEAQRAVYVRQAAEQHQRYAPCDVPDSTTYGGLKVVGSAKALGVQHMATGQSLVDWSNLWSKVQAKLGYIAHLPLSMFGRAFACDAYALSKLLYAAEFVGALPLQVSDTMQKEVCKLVDRGQAPHDHSRAFAGVAAELLVGHPKHGGCGLLPLSEHIVSRHAMWGIRHSLQSTDVPWVHIAKSILQPRANAGPAWAMMALYMSDAAGRTGPTGNMLPPPLLRLAQALHTIPPMEDIGEAPLVLGVWCSNAPLWCNPFLVQQQGHPLPRQGLEHSFPRLAEMGTINTVRDALEASREVSAATSQQVYQQVWQYWLRSSPLYADWQHAAAELAALVNAIPESWKTPVQSATPAQLLHTPSPETVWNEQLAPRLGWRRANGRTVSLHKVTVKLLTEMQLAASGQARAAKQATFLGMACLNLPPLQQARHDELLRLLQAAWTLKWDNHRKEVLWRLMLDALPTAERMHQSQQACACGVVCPGRLHHYWECPVAQAVVAVLQDQLHLSGVQVALCRAHVWLARSPCTVVHAGVWLVVALAALLGMDKGRKLLYGWSQRMAQQPPLPQQQFLQQHQQHVLLASKLAVATFWDMLCDFVGVNDCRPEWEGRVGAAHPFLCMTPAAEQVPSKVCVRRLSPMG